MCMEKMNQSKSKVDESSSKSNSVLGREEGFGSVSEEGSSSSHSHVNNLQEHQRLMMLRSQGMHRPPAVNQHVNHMNNLEEQQRRRLHYHRIMQRMRHTQQTDPNSSSINAPVYPPGSRFLPTDLGCARVHLRNMVDKKKSGFITTLDLYKDDPWLLDHVQNDLFPRGEWYYFTPRNKRGTSSCNRTVQGKGGGRWKSTSGKEPIKDKDGKVQGYKQSLVYNKTNVNGKIEPTGWNMTEYCLHEENQDDLVLCRIKGNLEKKGFGEEVKNNILSNQVQDHEEEEEEAGANGVEMMRTTLQEDHQQQQQPQEQDTPSVVSVPPPYDGQGLGVESNDNNLMTMLQEDQGDATQQQQQQPQECQDSEYMMTIQNNFTRMLQINYGDATQQQQQQEQEQDAPQVLVPPPTHEGQDSGFERMMNNENNLMMTMPQREEDHGDATQEQQQQQEQDAPPVLVPPPPHEGQDSVLEEMMNDENNFMPVSDEDPQYQWDASDLYIDVDKDFSVEEMMNDKNNFMPRSDEYQWDYSDLYIDFSVGEMMRVDDIFTTTGF